MLGLFYSLLLPSCMAGLADLERHSEFRSSVDTNVHVAVSPDDRTLYVGGSQLVPGEGSTRRGVAVFALNDQRTPTEIQYVVPDSFIGFRGDAILVSPDARHVYVATSDTALYATRWVIWVYTRDPNDGGRLTLVEHQLNQFGQARLHWTFDPTGVHLYVFMRAKETRDSPPVRLFRRDVNTGRLNRVDDYAPMPPNAPGPLTISPDGGHVYVGDNEGNVHIFRRDRSTGALSPTGSVSVANIRMTDFVFAPSRDGGFLYAGGLVGEMTVLARNPTTGSLLRVQHFPTPIRSAVMALRSLAVCENGLYAANDELGLASFARDNVTGLLTRLGPLDMYPGAVMSLAMTRGTDTLFAPHNFNSLFRYVRETACGLGVPEPCEESDRRTRVGTPIGSFISSVQPDLRCTLTREGANDRPRTCVADVFTRARRGFHCEAGDGVTLGIDRIPFPAQFQGTGVLSFITRDPQLGRVAFGLSKQGPLSSGFDVVDSVRVSNPNYLNRGGLLSMGEVVGGALVVCDGAACCLLPPTGGGCQTGESWTSANRSSACETGWRLENVLTRPRDPLEGRREGCAVKPLQDQPIPVWVQPLVFTYIISPPSLSVNVRVTCTASDAVN